jgi:glycosyltransferase involved in cell wall biosynthesis
MTGKEVRPGGVWMVKFVWLRRGMRIAWIVVLVSPWIWTTVDAKKKETKKLTLEDIQNEEVKPISIVFPQFHRIPENDKFWGEGFTEWTYLKPMPRYVDGIAMRKPHHDIGYYDLLDYSHRKYMREMADYFGVYGFCFYHFWFKNKPVMYKPTELMLADGEPNKPFFFCWANEAWTSRWDGSRDQILIDQDYSDDEGNRAHFMHLLPYFKHPNYIRVDNRPVFAVYRVEPRDEAGLTAIFKMWQALAKQHGLEGIHISRFFGPFNNKRIIKGLFKSFIEFEPGYSMIGETRIPTEPTIFPDGKFDEKVFRLNNPDLDKRSVNATAHYLQESERERAVRSSQFKVFNKSAIYDVIAKKTFQESAPVFRGTFVNWNNAPRRNFTNGNYRDYPTYITPAGYDGFENNLRTVVKHVENDAVSTSTQSNPNKFMFVTAWNEWNEQSTFEPNDIDGYDALSIVKKTIRHPGSTGKLIVHLRETGSESERYFRDLKKLFREYSHDEVTVDKVLPVPSNCVLLHIHGGLTESPGKEVPVVKSYQSKGARVVLTVHDFHWLFPSSPYNPHKEAPSAERVQKTAEIFSLVDQLIFPSAFLKEYYESALRPSSPWKDAVVVPPPDVLVDYNYLSIPAIAEKTLHVGFIGRFCRPKGAVTFLKLSQKLTQYDGNKVQYHVFGSVSSDVICVSGPNCDSGAHNKKDYPNIVFHGPFRDRSLSQLLSSHNIHALVSLSLIPEVYSYSLSHIVNSGLPVVYSNLGSTPERLRASYVTSSLSVPTTKYYPVNDPQELSSVLSQCLENVIADSGTSNRNHAISAHLQPSKWYISHYPLGR